MKIYTISTHSVRRVPESALRRLLPQRFARAQNFLREEDRLRTLGAGLLLHCVLGADEAKVQYGAQGKPYLPGGPRFSLSHSGAWAVLAVDAQPVGVDIELIRPRSAALAPRVFTADELAWLQTSPLENFYVLWTRKESILKATGLGLTLPPASVRALPLDGPNRADGTDWYASHLRLDDYVLACAAMRPPDPLETEEISP